eukprot:m.780706 g.780706  ORF g.780706 m.780706 type:complete len:192 (+) comp23283_c1_seq3:170-745(+)
MLFARAAIKGTAKVVVATGCTFLQPRTFLQFSRSCRSDNDFPPSSIPQQPVWSVQDLFPSGEDEESSSNLEISDDVIERLAKLSHLKIPQEEFENRKTDIAGILRFVRAVQEVDTKSVQPLHSVLELDTNIGPLEQLSDANTEDEDGGAARGSLREDVASCRATMHDIMANSPETLEGFFVAPKERHFGEQ